MIHDDAEWLSVVDGFADAAFEGDWYAALQRFAEACGARTGQLIGLGEQSTVPFNLATNVDPQLLTDFVALDGGNPAVNPRVRAGNEAPVLKVLAESDFISADEHRRHRHYEEFARPHDIPYICLTSLVKQPGMLIGLAVCRSQRQGHIGAEERRVFETIAPHVRTAVRTQMLLDGQGAAVMAGAMESLSLAAFVCDRDGRVVALTTQAEDEVRDGRYLRLREGQLRAGLATESRALQQAIASAATGLLQPGAPHAQALLLHSRSPEQAPLLVEVLPLSRRIEAFGFSTRALVVVRRNRRRPQTLAILQQAFGLTAAEADVALQLAAGERVETIAAIRGVAASTVRSQVRSLFAKFGVRSQLELTAIVSKLR